MLLHQGEVLADGPPKTILTPEALARLYGVEVRLVEAGEELFLSATPLA